MSWKIAVLGGSSPFTIAFIDSLAEAAASLPPFELVLHGRRREALKSIADYGARLLSSGQARVSWETDMAAALGGAAVVVHQIRYGDLALRRAGEEFCRDHEMLADETLGPAALLTAIRIQAGLASTTEAIARNCPHAIVLNLTNPLSCVTSVMGDRIERVHGLCELPLHTLREAAAVMEVDPQTIRFSYRGFNHRGFFYRLESGGDDLLRQFESLTPARAIGGASSEMVRKLGALPLKYFSYFTGAATPTPGRAAALEQLRDRIEAELREEPDRSPPSLGERYMEWYPLSVVPMLIALASEEPRLEAVNMRRADGLVDEAFAWVSRAGIVRDSDQEDVIPPSLSVQRWLGRFEDHERAFMAAVSAPSERRIADALAADPSVPEERIASTARAFWSTCPA